MYSAAGVRVGIYTALARGAASAKTSPLDPDRLIYLVGEEPTQIVFVTPSLGRLLLRVDLIDEWGHDVRLVRVVGDICSAELLKGLQRAFRRAHVANMYGLTEGGLTSSSHYGDQKVVAVGKASRDGRPVVVRRPGGEICTVGETGEITMKVGSDAPFYVLPPYEGRTRTHAEWLWTGDFGFLDQDGYVYVSGRYADTIISAGRKIAPVAVESSLTTVGDDLVVFGIQHAISGQVLAIATTDSRVSLHTCKNVLSGEPAWTPRCLLTVPRIFRNSMGKASRGALAQWLPQRPNERIQDGAMADELQILQGEVRANGAETAVYETTGGGLVLCVAISNDSSSSFNQLRRLSEKGVAVATANTHRFFDWHLPTGKAW
jgi:acyl-coenzyme A synthetase/AMP-(fatty) acid ligase